MVMSYQGQQAQPKVEKPAMCVSDYMTEKLISFHPDQSMDEAIQILLDKKISGGPVVDEENNLVGIISEGDCLKQIVRGKYNNTLSLSGKVKEYMQTDVKTMDPNLNIFEAARMFLDLRLRRFPIMKEGKLLGQISQRDVMCAVQKLKNETWGPK